MRNDDLNREEDTHHGRIDRNRYRKTYLTTILFYQRGQRGDYFPNTVGTGKLSCCLSVRKPHLPIVNRITNYLLKSSKTLTWLAYLCHVQRSISSHTRRIMAEYTSANFFLGDWEGLRTPGTFIRLKSSKP